MLNLCELDKLESYLRNNGYLYKRTDVENDPSYLTCHQIIVYTKNEDGKLIREWIAECSYGGIYGDCGYESDGSLNAWGSIVNRQTENLILKRITADDVIRRLENNG